MALVDKIRARRLPPPSVRRSIREGAGASLEELATELSVTRMTIYRWERGLSEPRPDAAIAYRHLLDQLREVAA